MIICPYHSFLRLHRLPRQRVHARLHLPQLGLQLPEHRLQGGNQGGHIADGHVTALGGGDVAGIVGEGTHVRRNAGGGDVATVVGKLADLRRNRHVDGLVGGSISREGAQHLAVLLNRQRGVVRSRRNGGLVQNLRQTLGGVPVSVHLRRHLRHGDVARVIRVSTHSSGWSPLPAPSPR